MKKTLRIIVLLLVALVTMNVEAGARSNKHKMTREELALTQAKHIASEVSLDQAKTEKFIAVYCDYQKELWSFSSDSKSSEREKVSERLERSQKILDLRKKYYAEYSKFLTEDEIEKVYKAEHKMIKRLSKKRQRRDK